MIKFIKQVANLWRIRKNPSIYEKGILRHLSIHPLIRDEVNKFHDPEAVARLARAMRAAHVSSEEFKRRTARMTRGKL